MLAKAKKQNDELLKLVEQNRRKLTQMQSFIDKLQRGLDEAAAAKLEDEHLSNRSRPGTGPMSHS